MSPVRLASRLASRLAPLLLAALSLAACASPAFRPAAEGDAGDDSFSRSGLYLGAYGLRAYENFDANGTGITKGDSDLGGGVRLGYRIIPRLAVEVVAEDIRGFNIDNGAVDADLDLIQYGVMAKFFILTGRFQPYLIGGGGAARADINSAFNLDDDGGFLRGGFGLDVHVTSNFAIFAEGNYNRMVGGTENLDHVDVQAGILFRF